MSASQIRFGDDHRKLLKEVSAQFIAYAQHHLAKTPPDYEKALVNIDWAKRCEYAATNTPDDAPRSRG